MTISNASALALIAVICACSEPPASLAGDQDAAPGADAAGDLDASISARWSVAEPIAELATAADERFGAPVSGGRVLYFTRTEMIGSFIVNVPYAASRASIDGEGDGDYGAATRPVAWGSTSIWEQDLADDQLEWFFWRGLGQLGRSARPSIADPWSFPVDLGVDGFSPSISGDGRSLYFISPSTIVAVMRRPDRDAAFAPPSIVPIEGDLAIDAIDVSADELTLLITADPSSDDAGIYLATRESTAVGFGVPEPVGNLVGPFESARFRADGREIITVLSLNGARDLYRSYLIEDVARASTAQPKSRNARATLARQSEYP